jgi:chromate reductase
VVGASTGLFGAVWAQAEARKVLAAIGARVVDRELPVALADDAFEPGGSLVDPDLSLALAGILAELAGELVPA